MHEAISPPPRKGFIQSLGSLFYIRMNIKSVWSTKCSSEIMDGYSKKKKNKPELVISMFLLVFQQMYSFHVFGVLA